MDSPIVVSSGESDDDDDVILINDSCVRGLQNLDNTEDNDIVFICVKESDFKKNKPLDLTSPINQKCSSRDQDKDLTEDNKVNVFDLKQESISKKQTAKDDGCVSLLDDQTTSNIYSQSGDSDTDTETPSVSNNCYKTTLDSKDRQTVICNKYPNTALTGCTGQVDNSQNIPTTSCDKFLPDSNGNPFNLNPFSSYAMPSHQQNAYSVNADSTYNVSDFLSLTSDALDTHAQTPISQDFNISQNIVSNYNIGFSSGMDYKNVPPRKRLKTENIVNSNDGILNNGLNGNCFSFTQFLASPCEPSGSDLDDQLSVSHVCCVCESISKGSNMSSCTDGHHTCSSCLEVSVKYILCQRDKQTSLKCPYIECDSFFLTSQLKRTMPPMVVEILEKHMEQNCYTIVEDETQEFNGEFPNNWVEMDPKEPFTMIKLQPGTDDYVHVAHEFHKTLPFGLIDIDEIYRVQNPILWKFFSVKKEQMMSDNGMALEKFLFHGTNPNSVDAICRSGFDWRLSGVNGTYYGKGSYFAEAAKYSHQYSAKGVFVGSSSGLLPSTYWRNSMLKTLTAQMSQKRHIGKQQKGGIAQTSAQTTPLQLTSLQPPMSPYHSPLNLSTVANGGTGAPPNISLQATTPPLKPFKRSCVLTSSSAGMQRCFSVPTASSPILPLVSPTVPTTSSTNLPVFKMFLARVLVGKITTGSCNLLKPPPIDPTNEPLGKCFDTCVDNIISPKIYVVFDIAQAYPEYVIHYKQIAPFS